MRSPRIISLVFGFWLLASIQSQAILDMNGNGLSDPWEGQFNNQQFFPNAAGYLPNDDPDSDGWTNAQEAAAGTNPFEANPPNGIIRPEIEHIQATYLTTPENGTELLTPETFTLTWPTITGKCYDLQCSPDLESGSWLPIGPSLVAEGGTTSTSIPVTQLDGSAPDKLFWRVTITDVDTDGDGLTNAEEAAYASNPNKSDSDDDGVSDIDEIARGSEPENNDSDGDNVLDGDEAYWWDPNLTWANTPETTYVVVNLGKPAGMTATHYVSDNSAFLAGAIQIEGSVTRSDWAVAALGANGHVLLVEDLRSPLGTNAHLNPGSSGLAATVVNHIWNPVSGSWSTLANGQTTTGNQQILGVAQDISKDGKPAGFAWLPVGQNGDPATGPGVQRVSGVWGLLENGQPSPLATLLETPPFETYPSFTTGHDALEIPMGVQSRVSSSADGGILQTWASYDSNTGFSTRSIKMNSTILRSDTYFGIYGSWMNPIAICNESGDVFILDGNTITMRRVTSVNYATETASTTATANSLQAAARITTGQDAGDTLLLATASSGAKVQIRSNGTWHPLRVHLLLGNIGGRDVSSDGTILLDGATIMRNGKSRAISGLVSQTGEWNSFNMDHLNDQGMMAGTAKNAVGEDVPVFLLPVDIDIVHPATGELAESDQHDNSKGGYIAVRRDDETPVTKLVIRAGAGIAGMKYKVKFSGGDKFKVWKDAARTQPVVSESTEFDPAVETVLFFEGLKKSGSVGAEAIILQAVIGSTVTTGETVYCTVVEAEFDVWLNVFIPIQWTDFPAVHPIHWDVVTIPSMTPTPIYRRKIAAGDDRTFINEFFENPSDAVDDILAKTSSRAHSQLTIIPFKELDQNGIKDGTIKDAIGESFNYLKDGSVADPDSGYSTTNRLLPQPIVTHSGRAGTAGILDPSLTVERYGPQNNAVRFKFEGSADNPIVNPSPAIDWDFSLAITVNNSNVLAPKWLLLGNKQDAFPAYEIYVRDSDGNGGDELGTEIYKYDPIPLGRTPADLFPEPVGADETVTTATGDVP